MWPLKQHSADADELAPYVSVAAIEHAGLALGREDLPPDVPERERRLRSARRRYDGLSALEIEYALPPYQPRMLEEQQIRSPGEIAGARKKIATCVDLAVLFSASCLVDAVPPVLAVGDDHAFVLLVVDVPDALKARMYHAPPGCVQAGAQGYWRVEDPGQLLAAIDRGAYVAVECTGLTTTLRAGFDEAALRPLRHIKRGLELVDVEVVHRRLPAFGAPDTDPALRSFGIQRRGAFRAWDSRRDVRERLETATGMVALVGDAGTGKSVLALDVAAAAPGGAAWFLNASDLKALQASLALAERAMDNLGPDNVEDAERDYDAGGALARLNRSERPWIVVLDNADGDPWKLRRLFPTPRPEYGQLLLITSVRRQGWADMPGMQEPIELKPLTLSEVQDAVGDPDVARLIGGRPLLLDAVIRWNAATSKPVAELSGHDRVDGPRALWGAIDAELDEAQRAAAHIAALLPPDHVAVEALGVDAATVRRLHDLGLLTHERGTARARMHRLLGRAVRERLGDRLPDVVRRAVRAPGALGVFEAHGDVAVFGRLADGLLALDERAPQVDRAHGLDMVEVARRIELAGDVVRSAKLYESALRHLDAGDDRDARHVAECLHGQARYVNQRQADDPERVVEAIAWAEEASQLRERVGESRLAGRHLALKGLLRKAQVRHAAARADKIAILDDAQAILQEAHEMRTATLPTTDREWDRSYFNLAGPYIERARVEPVRAEAHLTQAERIYKAVLDIRKERERGPHTHIAACYHGRALVDYYRALLVASGRGARTRLLRSATENANEALRQRELFDGGWDDDAAKTAALLAKIHVARNALNTAKATLLASHLVEIEREVLGADLVRDDRPGRLALPGPPRLTADTKLREFIDAWTRSVALMTLLRAFGATPPPTELPAGERLRALYALSEVWDFRRGAERGRGRRPPLTDEQVQVAQAATRALGLHDTAAPTDPRLDQIVVLGGLARACLARPARVAHLLGRGALDAPRITLLGAFRPTDAGERTLLRELLGYELAHEHAVLMTGAGRAFGIAPEMEVLERGGAGPQAWEVTAASTPDGRTLEVCAAPVPEGQARATTSSSLEWLRDRGRLAAGGRILVVTTYHYRVHQIAQALRVVGLGLGAKVDALGVRPGDADPRLEFEPDVYDLLGEVRSTIDSLRALEAALD